LGVKKQGTGNREQGIENRAGFQAGAASVKNLLRDRGRVRNPFLRFFPEKVGWSRVKAG